MAYTKQNFKDGQVLKAAQLIKIEDGIQAVEKDVAALVENPPEDGVSPVVEVSKADGVTTLKITDAEGEKTATINDGAPGKDGKDGKDGKTAYQYAVDGGYTGTEAEFAAKLAEETPGIHIGAAAPADGATIWVDTDEESNIPEALPNPNALTINGVSYDGSAPVEVNIEAAQSDWNAAEGEAGHVLGRTHWFEMVDTLLIDNQTSNGTEDFFDFVLVPGQSYKVICDGTEYNSVAIELAPGVVQVGNTSMMGGEDTGEPYVILWQDGIGTACMFLDESGGEHTLTLSTVEKVFHKIPDGYLPEYKPYYLTCFTSDLMEFATLEPAAKVGAIFESGRQIIAKVWISYNATDYGCEYLMLCKSTPRDPERPQVYGLEFFKHDYQLVFEPQDDGTYTITKYKITTAQA